MVMRLKKTPGTLQLLALVARAHRIMQAGDSSLEHHPNGCEETDTSTTSTPATSFSRSCSPTLGFIDGGINLADTCWLRRAALK